LEEDRAVAKASQPVEKGVEKYGDIDHQIKCGRTRKFLLGYMGRRTSKKWNAEKW
jgi:hypothetical protein